MSRRRDGDERGAASPPRRRGAGPLGMLDPAESVALVARAHRRMLLATHRHRLTSEDLEDCYSQATLELIARSRRSAGAFVSEAHIANALEQRFLSRVHDRRRALEGRSPIEAALAWALPLGDPEHGDADAIDPRIDVEALVIAREELRNVGSVGRLMNEDQRLVLISQIAGDLEPSEFCRLHGWSLEKYRKVAQRARARLRKLLGEECETHMSRLPGPGRMREQGQTYAHTSPPT